MTSARSAPDSIRLLIGMIVVLLCIAGTIATREDVLGDPDIWWHLKTGAWILQHKAVPTTDTFSYTFAGQPWIAKEWLSQVIYYLAFAAGGWNGVAALVAIVVGVAAGLLYRSQSESLRPSMAASVVLVCMLLTSSAITARPHLLTLPLLVIWIAGLFKASQKGSAPNFLLLVVILAWANLHAAFTMGFVIAFFAFLDFLETWRLTRKPALLAWLGFLALCPLVTLIHPYSYQAMMATLSVFRSNEGALPIGEWQPFDAQQQTVHAGVLLLLLFAALTSGFRLGLARALLIVVLTYLFMTHVRYAFFLYPVLVLLVAPVVARQFPKLSAVHWRSQPLDSAEQRMSAAFAPAAAVMSAVTVAMIGLQAWILPTAPPQMVAVTGAIDYVKSHGITGNVLNHYNFGGPLVFNDIPTFVDGRTDQLFIGSFGKEMQDGREDAAIFAQTLAKYDIRWTILPPDDPRLKLLQAMPGWKQVFADKFAVVYQREAQTTQ
ncbi:hypothetical protein [Aestuariivirga sp.]|uniref:hypothetical protein n=1 Tax=Aestuariivirga sp. TaxID=2650926 RepID=UPI0035B1FC36